MAENKLDISDIPAERIPRHIAIIMDGNGRWAKKRGMPRIYGHNAGMESLREIIKACVSFGVKYLTIYAFSTENWGRPVDELLGLQKIFHKAFTDELGELNRQGARIIHLGQREGIPQDLLNEIDQAMEITKNNDRLIVSIALNYGSRNEIMHAIQRMITDGLKPEEITEQKISEYLFTKDLPDPDLVIRTSGEQRLSNFLLYQSAYAEWEFPETLWPDFGKEELLQAIYEYSKRERRFGKV